MLYWYGNHYFSPLNTFMRKAKYPDPEHCLKGLHVSILNLRPGEGGGGGKSGDSQTHGDVQAGDDFTQVDHEVGVPAPHAHHLTHNGRLLILVFLPHLSVTVILNQKKRDEFKNSKKNLDSYFFVTSL